MAKNPRGRELSIIHVAKSQLGMDDDTYRDMLWTIARVRSAADLDSHGRNQVIKHLKSLGFKARPLRKVGRYPGHPGEVGQQRMALVDKVEALLASMKLPWSYADGIATQMFKIEKVRFCNSKQLNALIAALSNRQKKLQREQNAQGLREALARADDDSSGDAS